MADPYWKYSATEKVDGRAAFSGYIPSGSPSTASHLARGTNDPRGAPDFWKNDILSALSGNYGLDDHTGKANHAITRVSGYAAGDSTRVATPLEDPALPRRAVSSNVQSMSYGLDDRAGIGTHATTRLSSLAGGDGVRAYGPFDGPALATQDVQLSSNVKCGSYGLDDHARLGSHATRGFSPLENPALARRDVPISFNHNVATDGLGTHATRGFSPLENPALARQDVPTSINHNVATDGLGTHATRGFSPLENPALARQDVPTSINHNVATDGLGTHATRGFSPLENPALARQDVPTSINHNVATDGQMTEESNILFVDCLPTDCTRREVAHLFRPFIGFKEIRVVHKEPRRAGDKSKVLCFVEFDDGKCALTALEALQGYKFDNKKPDAPVLRIQPVKFPFHPPSL